MRRIEIGTCFKLNGFVVEVLEVKTRGWVCVKFRHNGETVNVRSNHLDDVNVMLSAVEETTETPKMGRIGKTLVDFGRFKYNGKRTVSGRKCFDVGDNVAELLRGEDIEDVYRIVAGCLGVSIESLKARYDHLNVGMRRMTLGNRLRKAVKGGVAKL